MQGIIITTLVVAVTGLIIGCALVAAGKKFHVEEDERVSAVRACLPGNNCGACGYAGCDAVAAAIVAGNAPVTACSVGPEAMVQKISAIMGTDADVTAIQRKTAVVKCFGDCDHTKDQANYVGIADCRAAVLAGVTSASCQYGCLGFGSCVKACTYDAIHVIKGVAVVDTAKCVGCGLCAAACPKGLIEVARADRTYSVRCSNRDKGALVRKICQAGCLGCGICVKQCEYDAIHVEDNLAKIDYDKCQGCGRCAAKCPAKVIIA